MPLREAAMSETKRKPGDYVHFEDCGCEKCLPKPETCPKCGSNCREIRICRHTSPPIEQRIAGTTYTHTIADPRCNLRCGHDWHKGATTVVTAEAPAQPTLQSGPNRERYIAKGPKVDGEQIRRPAKSCEAAASPSAEPAKPGETARIQRFWDALAEWSRATFGSDTERDHIGPLRHLAKEAVEAEVRPADPVEIADCLFLVFDAARRSGMTLDTLISVAEQKLLVNKARKWQKPTDDNPVEHVRGETASLTCHPHPLVKPGHPFTLHGEVNGHKWKLECPGLQESWTFELKSGGVRADCRVTVEEES